MQYKWTALSNTTTAVLIATIDSSIILIAMPDIFRGIGLNPLEAGNTFYLLWMMLGFLVVTSVLVVSLGRLGDMLGRVRIYNLGFALFTLTAVALTLDPFTGQAGALWLIVWRIVQGVGAACLLANSGAIITDAFPAHQRGFALGINNIAGVGGTFLGLALGGILGPIDWRLVFLVAVPFGLFGTVWSYLKLREIGVRSGSRIDWLGNITFAAGLILVMVGITQGTMPSADRSSGWSHPMTMGYLGLGLAFLVLFIFVETRVAEPMFRLPLFTIRAFSFGSMATFLSSLARGGLMFLLVIWLQGVWLPLHGVPFEQTPLWAGILMLPLSAGFLVAGPLAGYLSDRIDVRYFTTLGMLGTALSLLLLATLPVSFDYPVFALILFLNGVASAAFFAPNRAAVMNSLPAADRGAGGGMNTMLQNSAMVLSIGIFFTIMIAGFSGTLHDALQTGLAAHGVDPSAAQNVASLPPTVILFAAFLGYNPIQTLLGSDTLSQLSAGDQATLAGHSFFPDLVAGPLHTGLTAAFILGAIMCLLAAIASLSRGKRMLEPVPDLAHIPATATRRAPRQLRAAPSLRRRDQGSISPSRSPRTRAHRQ